MIITDDTPEMPLNESWMVLQHMKLNYYGQLTIIGDNVSTQSKQF